MKRQEPSLREQVYWILGVACWLFHFIAGNDVTDWYHAISGVAGYLAIVFTATAVWISMYSHNQPEPRGKEDS